MFDLDNALLIIATVMLTEFGRDGYKKLKEWLKSRKHMTQHIFPKSHIRKSKSL